MRSIAGPAPQPSQAPFARLRLCVWGLAGVALALLADAGAARGMLAVSLALLLVAAERLLRSAPPAVPMAPGQDIARAADDGSLELHFRPLRQLPTLALCGVEAELRWRHAVHGLLPPAQWPEPIPPDVADRLLAAWLHEACAQFARWRPRLDQRGAAMLWLPLPPSLLEAAGLERLLDQALRAAGLDASRLMLRVAGQPQGRSVALPDAVRRLQARGVAVALDGFGAEGASLAQLEALPVRTVCLDRSFIDRASQGGAPRLVVESTARLAASLGMQTLADGVANDAQVLALAALGCQLGLGEVCGPWAPAADWTARWSA